MTVADARVRHGVYRLFDANGALLYVGVSTTPAARVNEHRGTRWGSAIDSMRVEWRPDRRDALEAETAAILTESPLHNKRRSVDSDPVRTVRISDDLWHASQEAAWDRRNRDGVSGIIRLMLRAYRVNPDAMEREALSILGEDQ